MKYHIISILILWKCLVMYNNAFTPSTPIYQLPRKSGVISIVTYNINGLPHHTMPYDKIVKYLLAYDIILLQECFTNVWGGRRTFLETLNQYYYIHTDSYSFLSGKLDSSGIVTLSKFPIVNSDFRPFSLLYGADALTNKGILRATILINGYYIDIYNTHFQNDDDYSPFQCINDLRKFVIKSCVPSIIGGDFNMEGVKLKGYTTIPPEYNTFWNKKYDYFLTRGVQVRDKFSSVHLFDTISDHNAASVEISI